jgi:hypothetical protein
MQNTYYNHVQIIKKIDTLQLVRSKLPALKRGTFLQKSLGMVVHLVETSLGTDNFEVLNRVSHSLEEIAGSLLQYDYSLRTVLPFASHHAIIIYPFRMAEMK